MTVIPYRLRVPIYVRSREQHLLVAAGLEVPAERIPARTTLRVVDVFTSGLYALLPDGRHVLVSPETAREHGYIPKRPRGGT